MDGRIVPCSIRWTAVRERSPPATSPRLSPHSILACLSAAPSTRTPGDRVREGLAIQPILYSTRCSVPLHRRPAIRECGGSCKKADNYGREQRGEQRTKHVVRTLP